MKQWLHYVLFCSAVFNAVMFHVLAINSGIKGHTDLMFLQIVMCAVAVSWVFILAKNPPTK